jgi:uncharacterized membrane protein YhaH (DUF805 family)
MSTCGRYRPDSVRTRGASNRSFDTDTQRHCAARRAGEHTSRGAMPLRAGHSDVRAHPLKQLCAALLFATGLSALAALFGWWVYEAWPDGVVFWTYPDRCAKPAHSFGVGFALGLYVAAFISLLFSLVCFVAPLFRRWRDAISSIRRRAVIALLTAPLLLMFWPAHALIERMLPLQPSPGCPPYAP